MIENGYNKKSIGNYGDIMPDLTPMLDVIFILLIFFILTANTSQFAVNVTLPSDDKETSIERNDNQKTLQLIAGNKASYLFSGIKYESLDELKDKIQSAKSNNPELQIIIAADKTANVEPFMKMLLMLQNSGIASADILMDVK